MKHKLFGEISINPTI